MANLLTSVHIRENNPDKFLAEVRCGQKVDDCAACTKADRVRKISKVWRICITLKIEVCLVFCGLTRSKYFVFGIFEVCGVFVFFFFR